MGYRGMRHMGNQVQGVMGPIDTGTHGQWGTGGMGPIDNGTHGQWGTGGMAYRGMGPIDNGTHGQLGTGMGYPVMGNGVQG